jgi:N-acetylmuramoyl-L-alanine amidase
VLVIDGGNDPGAVANGVKEKDLNLSIALACRDVLKRHGVEVKMSRTKDEDDTLSEEIRECNAFAPDLAIDIHCNAGNGDGAEAFYHYG